jgi:hypothetical protein
MSTSNLIKTMLQRGMKSGHKIYSTLNPKLSTGKGSELLSTLSTEQAATISSFRRAPSPSALPVDRQITRIEYPPSLDNDSKVGPKNMDSSSGCATSNSTFVFVLAFFWGSGRGRSNTVGKHNKHSTGSDTATPSPIHPNIIAVLIAKESLCSESRVLVLATTTNDGCPNLFKPLL